MLNENLNKCLENETLFEFVLAVILNIIIVSNTIFQDRVDAGMPTSMVRMLSML